jgi:hypothetical protein
MPEARFSERLDTAVRLASYRQHAAEERFWNHHDVAALYPTAVWRMHCMARASVRLMTSAVARLEELADTEPIAAPAIEYLRILITEETGHDDWLLDSLVALGVSRDAVWAQTPPPILASIVGQQYYWIYHHHPLALLGFIKVVELDPSSDHDIDRVIARTGLPPQAFRYHRGHTRLELKHNDDLDRLLDVLPLTAEQAALVILSAACTVHAHADSIEELLDRYDRLGEAEFLYTPTAAADATFA